MMKKFTKKQIVGMLIGGLSGTIVLFILKKSSSDVIRISDFVPIIAVIIVFAYRNYIIVKEEQNLTNKKINAINNNYVFAYDNLLISKDDNNVIKVRNDLFWIDVKQKNLSNHEDLLESLITDFKKLSIKNKTIYKIMKDKIIEFSLIDNINYDTDKVLLQKKIEYNKLNKK